MALRSLGLLAYDWVLVRVLLDVVESFQSPRKLTSACSHSKAKSGLAQTLKLVMGCASLRWTVSW